MLAKHDMSQGTGNPTKFAEMSLDYRLFFGFHLCMMIVLFAHLAFGLGITGEVAVACGAIVVGAVRSVANRRKLGWRWPGAKFQDVVGALIATVLILFFIGAALPGTSPLNPNLFPWCAAGAGIGLFAILSGLHVVCQSEKEFLRQCGIGTAALPSVPDQPQGPVWKKMVATAFAAYFMLVWISGVGFFWKFNSAYRHGSPIPTATQTEQLRNHGHTVYITPKEKYWVDRLNYSMSIGIPSVFVLGGLLHFVLRIKIFSGQREEKTKS